LFLFLTSSGFGLAIICIGLIIRMAVAFLTVQGTDFNLKERFFIPLTLFSKGTVQAAIGAIAYDNAVVQGDADLIILGKKVIESIALEASFVLVNSFSCCR
jgi:hypothetical protein